MTRPRNDKNLTQDEQQAQDTQSQAPQQPANASSPSSEQPLLKETPEQKEARAERMAYYQRVRSGFRELVGLGKEPANQNPVPDQSGQSTTAKLMGQGVASQTQVEMTKRRAEEQEQQKLKDFAEQVGDQVKVSLQEPAPKVDAQAKPKPALDAPKVVDQKANEEGQMGDRGAEPEDPKSSGPSH